ncbi:Uncharacterised protein [Mycobacteroides abscessus subsp. abscessus]|nr:Uncharacterised protein [Mycobacteroides abscessus subsp. abscessus]
MDVAARQGTHLVDGRIDRQHVIAQVALQAAGFLLRRAKVDDPRVDAVLDQGADAAGLRRYVEHIGGEHQRRHQQHLGAARLTGGAVAP